MDPPILRHQRAFNRATRDAWQTFAPHRARVMDALLERPGGRLLVLGAGNCNDLDLPVLLDNFSEVHLADLDAAAVHDGVARQGPFSSAVRVHDSIDVTGIVRHLDAYWERKPDEAAIEAAQEAAAVASLPLLGGPFDVIVSACVLTQLIDSVVHSCGRENPSARRLVDAVRDRHAGLLLDLAVPGGRAILVTDMLSTARDPQLGGVEDRALGEFFELCAREDRCFAGTNPAQIEALLGPRASVIRRTAPWTWQIGPLGLLVYALLIDA